MQGLEDGGGAGELDVGEFLDFFAFFGGELVPVLAAEDGLFFTETDVDRDVRGDADAVDGEVGGGEVFGGGEADADGGVAGGVDGLDGLDGAFTVGGFTDEDGAAEVFEGAGDDFGGTGAVAVDEDDEGEAGVVVASAGFEEGAVGGGAAAFGGDDDGTFGDEASGDLDGGLKEAAGVVAEIEDEAVHAVGKEFAEGLVELGRGFFAELDDAEVAGAVGAAGELGKEAVTADGGDIDDFADDGDIAGFLGGGAVDGEGDGFAGAAAE